ncbi:riboflavin synthase [Neorickettsia sennetsu]|nr:riboflavin synthase [Neorickettsia sennetsu]
MNDEVMFKGIVQTLGLVTKLIVRDKQIFLAVDAKELAQSVELGSSIACNGVCLTVTSITNTELEFYVSQETFSRTNFHALEKGSKVNLETSLRIGDTLDGHFVQGHVDETTMITAIEKTGESHVFTFALTEGISPFITYKGSVCIDGTSLTVNEVFENEFSVNIIPYTWSQTIFHSKKVGDKVNVESDLLARYLKRLFEHSRLVI